MLIFRYLARDVIAATSAVGLILLLIVFSGRFARFLGQAATGKLEPGILFAVLGYQLPGFIELILPLAFFIAILLTYGRLYIENEMTVLHACGIGQWRVVGYTLIVGLVVALIVGAISLVMSPAGKNRADALLQAQKERADIERIQPRKFILLNDGEGVTYTEAVSSTGEMRDVFLVENIKTGDEENLVLIIAQSGHQRRASVDDPGHLILERGYRIQGQTGTGDYQVTEFEEYGQRIGRPAKKKKFRVDNTPTYELLNKDDPVHTAELQWRLSIPVLVFVVSLLAVPLSRSNPRQGRYAKMLPAILLYLIYLVSLNA
ncbi:MAG: LPS export ABC transporter permease LptF, partial [bacterium]